LDLNQWLTRYQFPDNPRSIHLSYAARHYPLRDLNRLPDALSWLAALSGLSRMIERQARDKLVGGRLHQKTSLCQVML
jgi:hypothetical protein